MNLSSEKLKHEQRFEFGKNWKSFLTSLNDDRIIQAEESLKKMLGLENLNGKTFLDIGSGSGLFSLAAKRMGATVHSFDYDPQSVACTKELKQRYFPQDPHWVIEEGSALDEQYLNKLGTFDIVYSWGVLHHTGDMTKAIELSSERVKADGLFFIAIYNDQGGASRRWLAIKKFYNKLPHFLQPLIVLFIASYYEIKYSLILLLKGRNPLPFHNWKESKKSRGMSVWHDWVDWCGGLPFEVAKPENIIVPLLNKGFILANLSTCGGSWGCNQYVFIKNIGS